MSSPLADEFKYYLEHQAELVEKYNGKVVVIKDGEVLGAFTNEIEAVEETKKSHALGTFLVQLVTPGEEAYRQTFHSRVTFG